MKKMNETERIIRGLVWKFRNIGYADPMYAPTVDGSTEALVNTKLEMVDEKRTSKLKADDFEDLMSEANVVLAELLVKKDKGLITEEVFNDTLYGAVKTRFMNLYRDVNKYGLTTDNTEELRNSIPTEEEGSYEFLFKTHWKVWKKRLKEDFNLHHDKVTIITALIQNDKRLRKCIKNNRFSKDALRRFCTKELGWKHERFLDAIADCKHLRF